MTFEYFKINDLLFMFDKKLFKIFMSIGDKWVQVVDLKIKNKMRYQPIEKPD
jgi:hypothetical protein